MRLNDPETVAAEFASEHEFAVRRPFYANEARDAALAAVTACSARDILEIGCGSGEFAARIVAETGAQLAAVDLSPRMVELARGCGVRAVEADAHALPFPTGNFDCVVALWMLYHLHDIDRALGEVVRVLRPGGHLVAVTDGFDHLAQLWDLIGPEGRVELPFSRENGAMILGRHFAKVERHDVAAEVVFEDDRAARRYVASTITRRTLADGIPRFAGPLRATCATSLFVATRF